jgi:hypothetical protein
VLLQKQTPQVTPDQRGLETSTLTDQESCLNDYEHRPHPAPTDPILRYYSPRVRLERYFVSYYNGTIVTGLPMLLSPTYTTYITTCTNRSMQIQMTLVMFSAFICWA